MWKAYTAKENVLSMIKYLKTGLHMMGILNYLKMSIFKFKQDNSVHYDNKT